MDAASRGFSYEDYLDFHKRTGCKSVPILEVSYMLVNDILNYQIEESWIASKSGELDELRN